MKIAINTRLLLKNKLEGIGCFTYENFRRIVINHPEHDFYFIFDRKYPPEFIFADNVHPVVVWPPTRHPFLMIAWFEFFLPVKLKKIKPDVFVSPDGSLSLCSNMPQVAVIHDINFYHRPGDLPRLYSWYYHRYFPRFARKARRIITVSEYSKKDICRSYKIISSKVEVVYNGVNTEFNSLQNSEKRITKDKYTRGSDYFMFVGSLHPRKNIGGLLNAFEQFKNRHSTSHKLVIVGEKMFLTSDIDIIHSQMRFKDDVVFTGRLDTSSLKNVLGAASALVFIPFFEGFGLPIVEAMNAGVPVICSDNTSLPEVAGDAALYVHPADVEMIVNAMYRIITDEQLRLDLISKGQKQRKKFSWDVSAVKLWEAIEKVITDY
jgi:glycosyltransferase involved in cell wall biosynthesis